MKNTILGKVRFNDIEAYKDEWAARSREWCFEKARQEETRIIRENDRDDATLFLGLTDLSSLSQDSDTNARWWRKHIEDYLKNLSEFIDYCKTYEQPANVYSNYEGIGMVVGLGSRRFFLYQPDSLVAEYVPVKDYSEMSVGEMRALATHGASSTLPASVPESLSVSQVREGLSNREAELNALKANIEDTKNGTSDELRALKEEVERAMAALEQKKEKLMAELSAKREALEEQVEMMNNQIYLLESQIYAIRCYMGETINFTRIRTGRNAPEKEPVVLFQKLRFLDEEMGRLASIYNMKESKLKYFEEFLAASPVALDTFAPSEKCVALVRLSKTGKHFFGHEMWSNMLDSYNIYHGNTIGVIIRNGENVYIGWTDPEEVHVTDDFIMEVNPKDFRVNTEYIGQEDEYQRKQRVKEERSQARSMVVEMVSRIFLFNILQGVVDSSNILSLPDGVKISKSSEYVVFSMADRWLTDNRYGSFVDIVKRCNKPDAKKGDSILTVLSLTPGREYRYRPYWNDRGRGDRNRTHDCSVDDCAIYPINLVEYDAPEQRTYYLFNGIRYSTYGDGSNLGDDAEIIETVMETKPHFFVSVEKGESINRRWYADEGKKCARSNFEVFRDEYINLAFMNSEWLTYAINTKNLGGWIIGGKCVDYAYGIKYLNVALQHIRQREASEKEHLDRSCPGFTEKYPSWMVDLSEWKLAEDVHSLHSRNVSRFLKWFAEKAERGEV